MMLAVRRMLLWVGLISFTIPAGQAEVLPPNSRIPDLLRFPPTVYSAFDGALSTNQASLTIVSYRQQASKTTQLVVQQFFNQADSWISESHVVGSRSVRIKVSDDLLEIAQRFSSLIGSTPLCQGDPDTLNRVHQASRAALQGDGTLLRELSVEPWQLSAVWMEPTPYLPRSIRSRVEHIILQATLDPSNWQVKIAFQTSDDNTAIEVGQVLAGWRDLILSLTQTPDASVSQIRQELNKQLLASSVSIKGNTVLMEAAISSRIAMRGLKTVIRRMLLLSNGNPTETVMNPEAVSRVLDTLRSHDQLPESQAKELLLQALTNQTTVVRATAARSLAAYHDPTLIPPLISLLNDPNDRVRAAAIWSLCQTANTNAIPAVARSALKDPSDIVRYRAVGYLGLLNHEDVIPSLIGALTDAQPAVREQAALTLWDRPMNEVHRQQLAELVNHPNAGTRQLTMFLLSRFADKTAAQLLLKGLQDVDNRVVGQAILSLGRLRVDGTLEHLRPLLRHRDPHVRGTATYAMGLIASRQDADAIRPQLKDKEAFIRALAAEALQRLGDKSVAPPAGFHGATLYSYPRF